MLLTCTFLPFTRHSTPYLIFKNKQFFDSLPPINIDSFFITPTEFIEFSDIISSLDVHKVVGPNSIPTKALKLLNKDLFNQLASLFNLSLSSGIFSNI